MSSLPEEWEALPIYKECSECGTYNLVEDHFCGYCAEDFCPESDTCIECNWGWIEQAYPDLEVY